MKLSLNWLGDFIKIDASQISKVEDAISLSICEIDEIVDFMPYLESVISVKVLDCEFKEDLGFSICKVSDGVNEIQVVSGDKTVQVGEILCFATHGTKLPEKDVQKTEIRGVFSAGMFVSEREIGLTDNHIQVLRLDKNSKIGVSVSKILGLEDKIINVDNKSITHRPDLWSHFGFARELGAQLSIPIHYNPLSESFHFDNSTGLEVVPNSNAHSYYACEIDNIQIQPSIMKIKSRLERCGVRSINNIVDVSNYGMLEFGQPTHFFDKDTLQTIKISVDYGKDGESLQLLDGTDFALSPDVLIIRNIDEPVAIAGVMGGSTTSVQDHTKNLVLESAVFKREDIRKSIKKSGIRSEAAIRYEKGLDSNTAKPVINRILNLLVTNGCNELKAKQVCGYNHNENKKVTISTNYSFINKKLGYDYSKQSVNDVLNRLRFEISASKENSLQIKVPNYRHNYDVTIPEDIVEEVGRTVGFHTIPFTPLVSEVNPAPLSDARFLERKLKVLFSTGFDFHEVFNYSFSSSLDTQFEGETDELIPIQNTMPEEYQFMRNSIYPSLLRNVYTNIDRFGSFRIFELGRTYHKVINNLPNEKKWLGFVIVNQRKANEQELLEQDFIYARKEMENILSSLNIKSFELEYKNKNYFHPNCSIELLQDKEILLEMGYLHPKKADIYNIKKRIILGRIDMDNVLKVFGAQKQSFYFKTPSQFPQDKIDISLLMDKKEGTDTYYRIVLNANIPEIENITVHSIYTDKSLGEEKKSVTYRVELITYQQTFNSKIIQDIMDKLIELANSNGFQLR